MHLIIRIEVDTHLLLAESPISVSGVQRNDVVLRSEFGDVSPLAVPKPLEDDEEDERKREILEKTKARCEDGTLPVDPRDPQAIVWTRMSVSGAARECTDPHFQQAS